MLEGVTKAALETLLAQGTGWIVAVLLIVAVIFLNKKNDKMQTMLDNCRSVSEEAAKEQFEKRLSEFKNLLEALNRSSEALATMRSSVDARTEAINQLVAGFANLVRDLEINRDRWSEKGEAWSQQIGDIRSRAENMQQGITDIRRRLP